MAGIVRRHVWVSGRVQGVFFRAATVKAAKANGVSGWVRNLPDGRVEAVFEGPAESVEAAVSWCRHGPEHAVVDHVEIVDEEPRHVDGFSVTG